MNEPIYFSLYALFQKFIYGADAVLTEHMELTLTILATAGSLFVVAIPFLLVWRVLRLFS